eukprot:CAMPEP_0206543388 /NCGR_PEP_ID=MMETSP0325_2-20121206/10832_1 /ASSEMBLY_ACC=CAM_ASM_000347 /TAXON_ID=2866 /ORGANISM="Crypthecodinium cohnii, Strain Seligo" /LENGTH=49 /DNA_ID= /DNA_START= /DNA_END= /DNA_ORIENTATION=
MVRGTLAGEFRPMAERFVASATVADKQRVSETLPSITKATSQNKVAYQA